MIWSTEIGFAFCVCLTFSLNILPLLFLIHTRLTRASSISHCSVYLQKTESCSTSHSLVVWTQEANWPYRGQTHKAVLAVGWRGMHKCMCSWASVCMCVDGGGGGRHFLLFFCCWRVPMSAPARSYSVAWAGQASASLASMTPPHTLTQLISGFAVAAAVQVTEQQAGQFLLGKKKCI